MLFERVKFTSFNEFGGAFCVCTGVYAMQVPFENFERDATKL